MVIKDAMEEAMSQALLDAMELSTTNLQIAEQYLDMNFPEEPELLKGIEPQNFKIATYFGGRVFYLEWLQKRNRKEELGRYVRFIVEAGGSTAWKILVGPYSGRTVGADLNKLLILHTGEHAAEQRIAVSAGAFGAFLGNHSCDAGNLCQAQKDSPEMFLQAMAYCHDCDGHGTGEKRSNAKMLLAAMYLYHMPVGTAPDMAAYLQESMIAALEDVMAFEPGELTEVREFARTAKKNTPFPQRILSIFSARKGGENPAFLAGCAFLAIRHSVCFEIILRIMVAVEHRYQGSERALDVCRGIAEDEWFQARMEEIEEMLPIQDDQYVRWSLKAGCGDIAARMAVKRPEMIRAAASMMESGDYEDLMGIVQNANPGLYEEMKVSYRESLRNKIVAELLNGCYTGRVEMKKYLVGESPVEVLEPYVEEWSYNAYQDRERYRKIEHLKKAGEISVYRHALVVEILKKETGYFESCKVYAEHNDSGQIYERTGDEICAENSKNIDLLCYKDQLRGMLRILEEEGVPVRMQTRALGELFDKIRDRKKKALLFDQCVNIFAENLLKRQAVENIQEYQDGTQSKTDMEEAVAKGNTAARVFCFMVFKKLGEEKYRDIYLSCAEDSAKPVRKLLLDICKEHREWEKEILALLSSKKLKAREFAVLVLEEWGDAICLEKVKEALKREKNKKLAEMMGELVEALEAECIEKSKTERMEEQEANSEEEIRSGEVPKAERTEEQREIEAKESACEQRRRKRAEERLAVQVYKGAAKRKVEWVTTLLLPEVHGQDGETVSQEYMLAILAAYADMDETGVNQNAVKLAAPLNAEEVSRYMQSLYEEWMQSGAEARKRWVLYAAAIHGGVEMVPVLYAQIKEWAEHSRGAIAAEAVKALALNGSSEALILVDQMSRKFIFRQIKNAAGEAISNAASALGIEREELEDRLVPDMGFDRHGQQSFDYGSRKFTVRLNAALEMEVYDEKGKHLKKLPSPGKQDDSHKAEQAVMTFQQMKKQLKVVGQTQKLRLEQALSTARFWKIPEWRELFVKNPIMHQFAIGLVWGVYENGILKETFRYMEDGSFSTVEEDEYALPGYADLASPGQRLPGQEMPGQEVPGNEMPGQEVPGQEMPGNEMPGQEVPGQEMPGNEASGQKLPGLDRVGVVSDGLYRIGLVHPLELSEEELLSWQTQLADYEVIQPFHQMNRPVYVALEEEREQFACARFDGSTLNGLSLSGKLLGMGWYRGRVMDGGFFDTYYHNDGDTGAELTFSGSSAGYENEEITVYSIYFYKLSDTEPQILLPNLFSEENKCKIGNVNKRYFSEIILQIARALENNKMET